MTERDQQTTLCEKIAARGWPTITVVLMWLSGFMVGYGFHGLLP